MELDGPRFRGVEGGRDPPPGQPGGHVAEAGRPTEAQSLTPDHTGRRRDRRGEEPDGGLAAELAERRSGHQRGPTLAHPPCRIAPKIDSLKRTSWSPLPQKNSAHPDSPE